MEVPDVESKVGTAMHLQAVGRQKTGGFGRSFGSALAQGEMCRLAYSSRVQPRRTRAPRCGARVRPVTLNSRRIAVGSYCSKLCKAMTKVNRAGDFLRVLCDSRTLPPGLSGKRFC